MSSEDQKPKGPMSIETDLGSEWGEDFQFEEIEIEEDLEDLASVDDGDILLDGLDEDLDEWEEYIDSHWIDIIHE
jgi:hypothetical protein